MSENQEIRTCNRCGCEIENDDYYCVDDDILCEDCADEYCVRCDHCGDMIYRNDAVCDEDTELCEHCFDCHYTRCYDCGRIIRNDDSYYSDDYDFCFNCYDKRHKSIREYSYKPIPILYGEGKRFLGVELEVDMGGHDDENAEKLLNLVNDPDEQIYIKSDGSLDDGFEIVTHPMTLDYHMNEFPWDRLTDRCIHLGYRSHQTSTCGLHVHVSRAGLGESYEEQENTISHILYFVEHHWNELLRFSRRSEYSMNRWAARHGYEHDPKKLLDKAKSDYNRYVAVNLLNSNTIEFRLFRGTLKLNTILATLQLVDQICETAIRLSDGEAEKIALCEEILGAEITPRSAFEKSLQLEMHEELMRFCHAIEMTDYQAYLDSYLTDPNVPEDCWYRYTSFTQKLLAEDDFYEDYLPYLAEIEKPQLLIVGEYDMTCGENQQQFFCKHAPVGKRVILGDSAHLSWMQQPEQYTETIREFAERI